MLVGRIIFHLSRGVPVALTTVGSAPSGTRPVGEMLGRVSRVTGPNRIFYEDLSGTEKYVSMGGIGFVCDSEAEALQLEELRRRTAADVAQAVAQVRQRLEEDIAALVRRSTE